MSSLDSRVIYNASHHLINDVTWLNSTFDNGAWLFFGNGDEIKSEFVIKTINQHFERENLCISWTREGSKEVLKQHIGNVIESKLGVADFSIWDVQFKKVIQFSKNGVMRCGIHK